MLVKFSLRYLRDVEKTGGIVHCHRVNGGMVWGCSNSWEVGNHFSICLKTKENDETFVIMSIHSTYRTSSHQSSNKRWISVKFPQQICCSTNNIIISILFILNLIKLYKFKYQFKLYFQWNAFSIWIAFRNESSYVKCIKDEEMHF